jgi:hypothetical protein
VATLPEPDADVLGRRLDRLQRNARILAERLGERARVSWAGCGSYLVLDPGVPLEEYVARALASGACIRAGSSFGFDTTRLYVTGEGSGVREPFLRIAAGTEHRLEIEAVAEALSGACG